MKNGIEVLDSSYSWLRLFFTLIVATVGNAGMWIVILVLPEIQDTYSISRSTASIPNTLTMIGFGLGNLYFGRAIDKYGAFYVVIIAAILNAIGFYFASISITLSANSVCHLLIGFGTGASFAPLVADVSLWFKKRRGVAVAIASSGNYFSGAVWPFILGGVLETQGWETVYHYLAMISIFAMIPLATLLRRKIPEAVISQDNTNALNKISSIGLSKSLLIILLSFAGFGCCVAMSMPQIHIVALCTDLGFSLRVGSEMLSLMLIGGIISRFLSGILSDYVGGVYTLLLGSTLQCISLFLFMPFDGLVPLYVVSLIFGLSQGGIVPSYTMIIREYIPASEAGTKAGLVLMMTILGMAFGGWISGPIYDLSGSYQIALWNGVLFNVMNIVIILCIFFRTNKLRSEQTVIA